MVDPNNIEDNLPDVSGEKPTASGVRSEYRRGGMRKRHRMATHKRKKRIRKSSRPNGHSPGKNKIELSIVKKAQRSRLKKIEKIKARKK